MLTDAVACEPAAARTHARSAQGAPPRVSAYRLNCHLGFRRGQAFRDRDSANGPPNSGPANGAADGSTHFRAAHGASNDSTSATDLTGHSTTRTADLAGSTTGLSPHRASGCSTC